MGTARHRIRTQRWVVRAGSTSEALAWRRFVSEQGHDLLLPLLEKAFDEAAADCVVHIPRLEIHLQTTSPEHLAEALSSAGLEQLKDQLSAVTLGDPGSGGGAGASSLIPASVRFQMRDGLLHYLRTGLLPWVSAWAPASESYAELVATCLQEWPRWSAYRPAQPDCRDFAFRALQLLPGSFARSWLEAFLGDLAPDSRQMAVTAATIILESERLPLSPYARLRLAAELISAALERGREAFSPELMAAVLETSLLEQSLRPAVEAVLRDAIRAVWLQADGPEAEGARQETPTGSGSFDTLLPEPLPVTSMLRQTGDSSTPDSEVTHQLDRRAETQAGHWARVDPFPLLVPQAGLVLLHPFFTAFLERTGVVEKGARRVPPERLSRGAALLHLLAADAEDIYEFELGFIKVLLGVEPATPVLVSRGLVADADREEAEGLLHSVIDHWSALKRTSVQGLRSSFLQRQGLLREDLNGWRLNIERKPFDMLLEKLPWSFSTVRLPWMNKPLHTEW